MVLKELEERYSAYAIQLRRRFHRCPEPALEEKRTCAMIFEELRDMGLSPKVVCGTGVLAEIGDLSRGNRTVCIRADIDALRVTEETGVDYASENPGFMHACGHDTHIAMALTCARILTDMQDQLKGRVRMIFEPAEEISRGAVPMIQAGALEQADTVCGLHVWSGLPAGVFSAQAGSRMASADFFTITIHGKGTHGSLPHKGIDSVAAAAAVIQNLQLVFSREFPATDTALISFCQIHGGNTDNAIPETVTIGGTTRAFDPAIRDRFQEVMERVIAHTAEAFGARGELDYRWGSPPMINDERAARRAALAVEKNYGREALAEFPHTTGGEDFAEYQAVVPGVFLFLGIDNEAAGAVYPNHSSHFNVDESVLIRGAITEAQYALDFLEEGFEQ